MIHNDLDTIEARWCKGALSLATPEIAYLIAEVRRLRGQVESLDKWLTAANAVIRDRAIDEIANSVDEYNARVVAEVRDMRAALKDHREGDCGGTPTTCELCASECPACQKHLSSCTCHGYPIDHKDGIA